MLLVNMLHDEEFAGSGWLLNPAQGTTTAVPGAVDLNQSSLGRIPSSIQAASSLFLNVLAGSGGNQSTTFDRWFFTSSEPSSDVYLLAAFLLFLFLCLILTLPALVLICKRSRTASNVILFHYFLSNWIFLAAQLIRFVRAQQSKWGGCPRLGNMGPWFYMDILSTPMSYISLGLLAVERFSFHVASNIAPLRWIRSPSVPMLALILCWIILGLLDIGLYLLVRMLSISDILRPVAASIAGAAAPDAALTASCANPLAGAILSPVRDILMTLFVSAVAAPAILSVVMQICLHCATCRSRRNFQRSSLLAFGIIFSHLAFGLPHVTIGVFTPSNYPALAWLLTLRAFQCTLAVLLFLLLDPAAHTLLLSYLLHRKPPPMSSTLNTAGDIDTLIASVDVSPDSARPSTQVDAAGSVHDTSGHQVAQHPYLAIRPPQLYFERPQSAFNMDVSGHGRQFNRSLLYNHRTASHQASPVPFPQQGLSPRPPPLPPRRWAASSARHHTQRRGASSTIGGNSRSLPTNRRRLTRRHESHTDLGPRRTGSSTAGSAELPPHRPAHRLYQSDYRLSLCDERMITIDSRSSPGGWFECVITNEEEV